MSTANKLSYLNDTKSLLRTSLNKFGSSILSTDTFRSYDTKLNEIYDKLPKVTQSGAGFTLENVQNGQVDDFKMNGVDLEQETVETITISDWVQGFIDENTGNFLSVNYDITTNNFIPIFPNILYNISRTIYTSFMRFRFYDENKTYLGSQQYIDVTTNKEDNRMLEGVTSMQLTINDDRVQYMKICDHSNDLSTVYTITTNATPSPDYPQDIKVVEGRQVITDKGKNLFDKDNITKLNGTININSNDFEGGGLNYAVCISCKPNTTYTVTKRNDGNTNRFALASSETIPSSTISELTPVLNKIRDNDSSTLTLTTEISANYLIVQYYRSAESILTEQQILDSIQIEESSTATNYEPYHDPVNYNIDLTNDLLKYSRCNFTPTTTSWYFLNGSGGAYGSNIGTKTDIKFPVEINKKYTLRYNISIAPNTFQLCYENENVVATLGKSSGNNTFTFTSDRNGYVILRVQVQANTQVKITDISAVEGEEDYYDYKLAKIPNTDYKNRIYKNNGNWYFEENAKKVVLDGSEVITIQNIGTDNWYYQLSVNCYKTEQLKQMCSHYKNSGIYNSNTYEGIMMLTDGDFIRIRYGEEDTVANFKAWLSNNNVELWYPLINSITTQITNTTLINQLEAISVHTGTNIITISNSNNIIPEIEITRLKELEKLA